MDKFLKPNWPAPAHVKAYTTTRHAWTDEPLTENVSLHTLLDLPAEPIWLNQKHTNIALPATVDNRQQIADACFSNQARQVCAVLTADCLPLFICNKQGTHVAAIHAGWRGLAAGIIESTLQGLNQPSQDLMVWLGPAISQPKFEVGLDVYEAFTLKHEAAKTAFIPHGQGKWLANLYELAKIRLNLLGITQIYGAQFCTYSQDNLFFSYRRDGGKTGRMISLIWINETQI